MTRIFGMLLLASVIGLAGCESKTSTEPTKKGDKKGHSHDDGDGHKHDSHDDHARGKAMLEDAGPYHAALTAHLSPKGNELDLSFESIAKEPKPVALPLEKIVATVTRKADNKPVEVTFLPAPADERPKDEKAGTCSHFVAKTPFVLESDTLTVTIKVMIRDKDRVVTWEEFAVSKFSEKHNH